MNIADYPDEGPEELRRALASSSSLDPHETNDLQPEDIELVGDGCWTRDNPPAFSSFQSFRHGGWLGLRSKMRAAMVTAAVPDNRLRRFDSCGSSCSVWHSESTGRSAIMGDFCKCRECVPCARAKAALIATNVAAWIRPRKVRFITLSLRHRNVGLKQMIKRAKACFKELREESEWKENVHGCIAFMEAKFSKKTDCWHVHFHILGEGRYWAQERISKLWLCVTGDSMITDVRAVTDARGGAYYASKYATKPFDAGSIEDPERLAEAVDAFSSCRMWEIFGSWKGKLKPLAKAPDPGDWKFVCSLNSLCSEARSGDDSALKLVIAILNGEDTTAGGRKPDTS